MASTHHVSVVSCQTSLEERKMVVLLPSIDGDANCAVPELGCGQLVCDFVQCRA